MKKLGIVYLLNNYPKEFIIDFFESINEIKNKEKVIIYILYSNLKGNKFQYSEKFFLELLKKYSSTLEIQVEHSFGIRDGKILDKLDKIETKYIFIVDGDDYVNPSTLDKLLENKQDPSYYSFEYIMDEKYEQREQTKRHRPNRMFVGSNAFQTKYWKLSKQWYLSKKNYSNSFENNPLFLSDLPMGLLLFLNLFLEFEKFSNINFKSYSYIHRTFSKRVTNSKRSITISPIEGSQLKTSRSLTFFFTYEIIACFSKILKDNKFLFNERYKIAELCLYTLFIYYGWKKPMDKMIEDKIKMLSTLTSLYESVINDVDRSNYKKEFERHVLLYQNMKIFTLKCLEIFPELKKENIGVAIKICDHGINKFKKLAKLSEEIYKDEILTYGTFNLLNANHRRFLKRIYKQTNKKIIVGLSSDKWNELKKSNLNQNQEIRAKNLLKSDYVKEVFFEDHEKACRQWNADISFFNAKAIILGFNVKRKIGNYKPKGAKLIFISKTPFFFSLFKRK